MWCKALNRRRNLWSKSHEFNEKTNEKRFSLFNFAVRSQLLSLTLSIGFASTRLNELDYQWEWFDSILFWKDTNRSVQVNTRWFQKKNDGGLFVDLVPLSRTWWGPRHSPCEGDRGRSPSRRGVPNLVSISIGRFPMNLHNKTISAWISR